MVLQATMSSTALRSDSANDLAVIEWMLAEKDSADILRQPYLDLQQELLSFYMNYRKQPLPQGLEWMSGDLLADSFMLVESMLPSIAGNVLDGKSVTVNAYTMAGTQINMALDKALYRLRRVAAFEKTTIPSIRMAGIFGHQFQKNIWVTEWGNRRFPIFSNPQYNAHGEKISSGRLVDYEHRVVKKFDGPRTYYPDTARVWKSAATNALGDALFWCEEVTNNLDYMHMVNDDYKAVHGEPFYDNLDTFTHGGDVTQLSRSPHYTGNAGYNVSSRQRTATEQASGLSTIHLEGHNAVVMYQGYATVPKHIRDYSRMGEPQERLVVFTPDGVKLRDVPMPTWNMSAPLHDIMFMQVANEPFGRTPLWWTLGETEQRSENRNLRLAEAKLNIFQTRIANRNANFDQNDFVNQPGGVWMYDHDTLTPQQAITALPRQPVMQEIYREDALAEDHMNRVFGSTPNMQGSGLGSRATLGEAQLVDSRAGGRADLISKQLAWQYELNAGRDYLGMFAAFSEEPLEVQVDGEEASFPVQIFSDEIDFDYDVEINAGEYGVMNGQSLMALREAFGLIMANPDTMHEIDPRKGISAYQHRSGMDNILRPQVEAQASRDRAMMAQIAASQAGSQQVA